MLKAKEIDFATGAKLVVIFQQRIDDMDSCPEENHLRGKVGDNDLVRRLLQSIKAVKDDQIKT